MRRMGKKKEDEKRSQQVTNLRVGMIDSIPTYIIIVPIVNHNIHPYCCIESFLV